METGPVAWRSKLNWRREKKEKEKKKIKAPVTLKDLSI